MKKFTRTLRALSLESTTAFLAYLSVIVGVPILVNPGDFAPETVKQAFPVLLVLWWAFALVFGGITTLVGLVWPMWYSMRIEQIGLLFLSFGAGTYALALASYGSTSGRFLTVVTFSLFSLSCAVRYRELGRLAKAYSYAQSLSKKQEGIENERS
jgi:hypothetical protein